MKLFYCTIVFCLLATSLFAQEKKLLQNFKYRIENYRAVNLSTDASGIVLDDNNFSSDNEASARANLSGNFNNLNISDKRKMAYQFGLNNDFSSSKNGNGNIPLKSNSINNGANVGISNTWFGKNLFLESGANIGSAFGSNKTKYANNTTISKVNNNFKYFAFYFGIGKGRVENITDMQNALWLNKALQSDKNLTRNLTEEELNKLGRAITKGNNTRVLDTRKRIKFLLKTVDGFLQEKKLINETNIDYFNSLNDILFYAFNNQRLAGSELYFRITPEILNQNLNIINYASFPTAEYKEENRFLRNAIFFTTGYKKYAPQNLMHQNNYGAALSLSISNNKNTKNNLVNNVLNYQYKNTDKLDRTSIDLFYEHSIYPNTRTNINFNINTSFGIEKANVTNQGFATVNVGANLNYFINYNTRFTAVLGGVYNKNNTNYNNLTNNNFNILSLQSRVGLEVNF